jgi:XFP N-terminal domain
MQDAKTTQSTGQTIKRRGSNDQVSHFPDLEVIGGAGAAAGGSPSPDRALVGVRYPAGKRPCSASQGRVGSQWQRPLRPFSTKCGTFPEKVDVLSPQELSRLDAYWRAANYLSVGQIYLLDNALLRDSLKPEHIRPRLLGHWGTTPGLNFIYVHLNRIIKARDLNVIYICGPGHGGPALVANAYLCGLTITRSTWCSIKSQSKAAPGSPQTDPFPSAPPA